jgi:phosphoglycerol transferase MdoB-like AlkP superfamily enzyme
MKTRIKLALRLLIDTNEVMSARVVLTNHPFFCNGLSFGLLCPFLLTLQAMNWKPILSSVYFLLKLLLFWILVFDVIRIFFILHNAGKVNQAGWFEIFKSFVYSFRLDLSAAAMLSVVPFIFYTIWRTGGGKFLKQLFRFILGSIVLIVIFIHVGEIITYPEWNHKLSTRAFRHLSNPDEVGRTASWKMILWFIFYALLALIATYFMAKKMFRKDFSENDNGKIGSRLLRTASFLVLAPFLVLFIRGGLQPIPINIDAAYYSKASVANDLSINSSYYFGKSFLLHRRNNLDDVFPKMNYAKALEIKNKLYSTESDTSYHILAIEKPNFVFIILEGWTANAIKSITGNGGVTPYFDELTKEGILFTQFFANGGTSEIGNATIFGGFPALPEISMSMQPEKHRKLPTLNEDLKKLGYYSGYLFGGDLKYGNMGSFLTDHGFDSVEDEKDFPSGLTRGRLNYHDEDVYKLFLQRINKTKEPFLRCAFTGSTHSPYDFPKRSNQTFVGAEQEFMNSLIYADEALHNFLEKCKKEKWYKNTLFVIVADHGHTSPDKNDPNHGNYFHIPLLFYGEAMKPEFKGKKIDIIGSQSDIVKTLLKQMNLDASAYPWSKDMLNPKTQSFALHTVTRGYGWITKEGNFSYNLDLKNYLDQNYSPENLKKQSHICRAYLVELYRQFKAL